jgi:hypothetical protein
LVNSGVRSGTGVKLASNTLACQSIEISAALAPRIDEVLEAAWENQELKEREGDRAAKRSRPLAPSAPYLE